MPATPSLLAPAVARLRQSRPGLTVHIEETKTPESFARLVAGDADVVAVVPTAESPAVGHAGLHQTRLPDDPFDLLVPAGHGLASRRSVALADAGGETWIATPARRRQPGLIATPTDEPAAVSVRSAIRARSPGTVGTFGA